MREDAFFHSFIPCAASFVSICPYRRFETSAFGDSDSCIRIGERAGIVNIQFKNIKVV